MSHRIFAVDGGQSGIRLADNHSTTVDEISGVSRLEGDPLETIVDLVAGALRTRGRPEMDVIVLGLSTGPDGVEAGRGFAHRIQEESGATRVIVTDDAITHHAGHFRGQPGISLALGTGVACSVLGFRQDFYSVSGYGFLLGDDGGAFWIGRQALRHVLDHQHLPAEDPLRQAVISTFGELPNLPARLHSLDRPVNAIAHFAREVLELSATDTAAATIVNDALTAVLESVDRALLAIGEAETPLPLVLSSRLFFAYPDIAQKLLSLLGSRFPRLQCTSGGSESLEGALWLGDQQSAGAYASHVFDFSFAEGTTHAR